MAEGDATSEGIGNAATTSAESVTDAPSVHFLEGKGVSSWKSVPAIVWYIHHDLTSHVSPHTDICRLAEAHPRDVVMTLLRCAPECDRAAAMMWRSIGSSGTTVEKVLPTLLRVMEDWPVHGMSTSDGDNRDVFALAATLALWLIIQEPNCQGAVMNYIPRLLMALLFQVSMSTEQVPEEVNTFWRGCLEQHHLPTQPNRFLVQTMKALLCHLPWEDIWMARKRRLAWDPLLNSDTHHYAVGLHVREMRRQLTPSHSPLAIHLLGQLSSEDPRWELPALEFLVELLDYLDGRRCHSSVEQILSRHLQSECPERRRLALRGRMVLWTDLSMAQSICSLSQHLLELLPDADGELVVMTLSVFVSVLRDKDIQAFISTAPKLAEVLWPLFDNLSSFHFLETVMEVLVEGGTKPLEMQMHQSLVLWFFLQYDEHQCVAEVPTIVRSMHQCLTSHMTPGVRMHTNICRLTEAHPHDVVMTLLRCAPECDRAAAMMWRSIGSSGTTVEKVLPTLLRVMEDWPVHRMSTSDGDNRDVFALAATLALWLIIQEPKCQDEVMNYIPRLLMALLFQVSMSTEQVPEEVNTFWRGCLEQHRLPTQPSRFLVQTIKALFCRLQWDNEVVSVERKCGWDTLLCADTQHYAVGLLAREMRHVLIPFYSPMAIHLLGLLSTEDSRWELPALAFLVEVLDFLDRSKCCDSVLPILSRNLRSQCQERQRLALRGLLVLAVDPSMAQSICSLSQHLLELLPDADGELVVMTLSVFESMLQDEDIRVFVSTAPKLAEALRPLFDNDNTHVQLLSIHLFQEVMELLVEEGTQLLETQVHQSLVPLFIHGHDENQCVAEASREVLLCAARFLKRRDLEKLLRREQHFKFCDCLMDKDVSRRAEHLQQALPYLQSPQQPLREAAVRFMGIAAWHMQDLQLLMRAFEAMSQDDCPSYCTMRTEFLSAFRRAVTK
ncbi:maestro heat-like repeat family member 5 [Manacus candei]|nr:maestro heat-like repeat family member 5 [Manacus candei]